LSQEIRGDIYELLAASGRCCGRSSRHSAALDGAGDALESGVELAAEKADGSDDNNCDEGDHDAVFDGGCALFVATDTGSSVREESKHFLLLSECWKLVLHQLCKKVSNGNSPEDGSLQTPESTLTILRFSCVCPAQKLNLKPF
jgi:hypothetical protein